MFLKCSFVIETTVPDKTNNAIKFGIAISTYITDTHIIGFFPLKLKCNLCLGLADFLRMHILGKSLIVSTLYLDALDLLTQSLGLFGSLLPLRTGYFGTLSLLCGNRLRLSQRGAHKGWRSS